MLSELLTGDFLGLVVVALGVGVVVGLTGMGGGALMTPALIFLGIPPTTAVANDLVAAVANKSVGAFVHWRRGAPDLRLAAYLVAGSVPCALAGAFIIDAIGGGDAEREGFVRTAIGVALLLASTTYAVRILLHLRHRTGYDGDQDPPVRRAATVLVGAVGGLLVGVTSVGSGSLIMVALLVLYPTLRARRLVGTDLVQAIPLVFAAALGHVIVTGIDWSVLVPLLIGGSPGTYLGARLASWVPQSIIRRGIAIVLSLTGLSLLGVPPAVVGILGAAMLILGPVLWGFVRRSFGRSAFDSITLSGRRVTVNGQPAPRLAPMSPDHAAARALAETAGQQLLRVRAEAPPDLPADELKARGDAAGQAALAALLEENHPQDAVLSEEAVDDLGRLEATRVWIIDPLDGTREFSERPRDDWAVHVALWEEGGLVAGAVALPARGRTYSTDSPAEVPHPPEGSPLRLAVSRSRPPTFVADLAAALDAELVPMGSAGVKAMSVVDGTSDAYVHAGGQYEWDSAAPVAVALAHGLHCSRIDGSPLVYNNEDPWLPDLLICRPELTERLLTAIAQQRSTLDETS